ncbi:MAG: division/cell wall cluster transcriptional repressor MraZ [Planctomycetota bacterium]
MSRRLPYSGRYTVQLDSKHRVILPSTLRKLAEQEDPAGDFFLTTWTSGCLHLYTATGFQARLDIMRDNIDAIDDDAEYDEAQLAYERFLHSSTSLKINEQGRLLIPADLVESAELEQNQPVHVVGNDDVIEIWSPGRYDARYGPKDTDAADRALRRINRRPRKRGRDTAEAGD